MQQHLLLTGHICLKTSEKRLSADHVFNGYPYLLHKQCTLLNFFGGLLAIHKPPVGITELFAKDQMICQFKTSLHACRFV